MANLVPFHIDLTTHEGTRLAAVLEALGPHWDPTQVFVADEAEAIACFTPIGTPTAPSSCSTSPELTLTPLGAACVTGL